MKRRVDGVDAEGRTDKEDALGSDSEEAEDLHEADNVDQDEDWEPGEADYDSDFGAPPPVHITLREGAENSQHLEDDSDEEEDGKHLEQERDAKPRSRTSAKPSDSIPICSECGQTFTHSWSLNRHVEAMHRGISFTCEFCDDRPSFSRKDKLVAHQRKKHGQTADWLITRRTRLPQPGAITVAPAPSVASETQNEPPAPPGISSTAAYSLACDLCPKNYSRKDKLIAHQRRDHGFVSDAARALSYYPPGATAANRKPHRPAHKAYMAALVTCTECHVQVKRSTMYSHRASHGGRRHCCEICGASFIHERDMRVHQRVHAADEKVREPYVCVHCDKRFARRQGLRHHMLLHTGKPHICDECGWSFSRPNDLKKHKRSHRRGTARTVATSKEGKLGPDGKIVPRRSRYKPRQLKPKPLLPMKDDAAAVVGLIALNTTDVPLAAVEEAPDPANEELLMSD